MKLVVIGLDGATFDLIDPRLATGQLPNLTRLLARSCHGQTTTTWPAHTGPGWPTFLTGRLPGEHGVHGFFEAQAPDYSARVVRSDTWSAPSLLELVAVQGDSVGAINVPMSHPPNTRYEFELSWPLESTLRFSHPAALSGALAADGARFRPDLHTMFTGQDDYLQLAVANIEERVETFLRLRHRYPELDVACLVLTETDRVCHHLWEDDAEPAGGTAVSTVYEAVDWALGRILQTLSDDTCVLLVSDHGFGPADEQFSVNAYLNDCGWLGVVDRREDRSARWFAGERGVVDWPRTLAYSSVPGSWGVNLNLEGRQIESSVRPVDRTSVLSDLADLLLEARTPAGSPVFRAVLRCSEIYPGPGAARGPDLLLLPRDEANGYGAELTADVWTANPQRANHRHEGMWALAGPGVVAGRREPLPLTTVLPCALDTVGLLPRASGVTDMSWAAVPQETAATAVVDRATDDPADDAELFGVMRAMGYV